MGKAEYKFNKETLEYERVKISKKDKVKKVGWFFSSSLFLAFIILLAAYPLLKNYVASEQLEENKKLKLEYSYLNSKFDELSKELSTLQLRNDSVYADIFGIPPVSENLKIAGTGGTDPFEHLRGYSNSKLMIETATRIKELESHLKVHQHGFERIEKLSKIRNEKLACIPAIQPIHNHNLIRTSSGFGMRMHPVYKVMKMHTGLDFTAKVGTKIFATGDGVIKEVSASKIGYGNHVVIDHGFGYETLYAHLSDFEVRKGQKIKRGEVIGYVGNTGTSTGPHLHYEVIKNGRQINPVNFFFNDITYEEYREMVEISTRLSTTMD
jgi:murein DD-endopeptidase MepM/ murein hydrolase activator NlpD